ncbi:hypothetical protein M2138_001825, partial [Dysgonomonadaceae bacterium PH5-43]|nr:hypothetical protein [Dysgonomonadaceae bacterium PH5-43]
ATRHVRHDPRAATAGQNHSILNRVSRCGKQENNAESTIVSSALFVFNKKIMSCSKSRLLV